MALATRRRIRAAFIALALLASAALWDAYRWTQRAHWNDFIRSGEVHEFARTPPPEVRFAQAAALVAAGDEQAALSHYRELQADSTLGQAARYNSANLLFRQAMRMEDSATPGQAIPLVELAKESYREVLRVEPTNWDAKYNLERAQRLLPDPEDGEAVLAETPHGAERAATTMRGFSPGLP